MGEVARTNGNHEVAINVKDDDYNPNNNQSHSNSNTNSDSCFSLPFLQKVKFI